MADTEKIKIVVDAEDNASGVLEGVKGKLHDIGSGISSLNSALRQYNYTMSSINDTMVKGVKEIGSAVYDFTSDSISNFSDLSDQHAKTLGAMANDYDRTLESQQKFIENGEKLRQQAIDLAKYGINGQGSLVNDVQISALQTELIKAGIGADTMLSTNVVSDVLQFAQANQLDNALAVEFAVSLGNQFGVSPENWGHMLDKVSHTADLSIIDVKDIVQSMKYAGGISSGIDRPIEETLAMISALGNFGLRGSQAGSGIQAFLTRLLTGDTTVISDAMAEVAPEKALKAFYDFSNYAKSSGSSITYDDIMNESFTENDITGELRPMSEVVDALESTMQSLNDEEQAWFAKKLFGLYQMKSAYALINGDDSSMALNDVIEEIRNNSIGTNANKLAELVNAQGGQIEVTQNLIDAIKTELGMMLEPTVLAVLGEAQKFLRDPGNYNINWDNIKMALDESCDSIEQAYGTAISDAVRNIGGITIDLGQVVEQIAPEFMVGIFDVFNSATSGNLFGDDGVAGNWDTMIYNMNQSLQDLPPNLQELGKRVIDVIDMFGNLAALNIATTVAQLVTSVLQIAMMTINAANVVVNGKGVGGSGGSGGASGTATAGTLASGAGIGGMIASAGASAMVINDIQDFTQGKPLGTSGIYGNIGNLDTDIVNGLIDGRYEFYKNKIVDKNTGKKLVGNFSFKRFINPFSKEPLTSDYRSFMEMYNNTSQYGGDFEPFYDKMTGGDFTRIADTINSQQNGVVGNMAKSVTDWSSVIQGYNALSESGQQKAIQDYLSNQIVVTPSFNMDAPQIQVDITIDGDGNVLSQKQSILNPSFNTSINNWYQRVASQNGSTTK